MKQFNSHDTSIAEQFRPLAEENKAKRKLRGEWAPYEPQEVIIDMERAKDYNEHGEFVGYISGEETLLSQQYIMDIFGLDWPMMSTLRFYRDKEGMVMVDGNLYFTAAKFQSVMDELRLLATSDIVDTLRPHPQYVNTTLPKVYTNEQMMTILGVSANTLRSYRVNGLIGYSQQDGKIWYKPEDLTNFLNHNKIRNNQFA